MEKLVLIDGNSLLNRAFYATPVFTTRNGVPTNAIFGFIKLLFKILEDVQPEYLIVAFDLKARTFRHEMYQDYKATRKGMPDDLAAQVEPLKSLLNAMCVKICAKEGFEADDIIGTLSKKFDVHSFIYTGDRDSFQLVDDKTDVYYTKRGVSDLLKLNVDNFKTQTGIDPFQVVDLKALMGDKSDNIPGVPGIGEKTARDLLERFVTLDGVYENLDLLKSSVKDKLSKNKDLAYLSYRLATIDRDCKIDLDLNECVVTKKYNEDVKKLFVEFEFNSFLGLDIFEENVTSEFNKIAYPEKIELKSSENIIQNFIDSDCFSVILNDDSAEIYTNEKLFTLKVSNNLLDEGVSVDEFMKVIRMIYSDPNHIVTAFDVKQDMHLLDAWGIDFSCDYNDVSLVKYLYDFKLAEFNLEELCKYYLYETDFAAFALQELYEKFYSELKKDGTDDLYEKIEKPLIAVLFDMEKTGVSVSSEMHEELTKHYQLKVAELSKKIYDACGKTFNLNSPAQLGAVLYEDFGIAEVKKKKTGKYATGAEVLEKLKPDFPIIDDILNYRMYQKLYSTYLEGFRPLIDKNTKRIHTTYHQALTTTGRLSSTNPNLQNIPIREDEGRELRKIFVPSEGNCLIDADYSQIELRLLAHFSECKELIEAYQKGEDIHSVTASQVFNVSLSEVTPKMRRAAKAVNFGIIYGMSEFGLSRNLDISIATAREYIEKYFATYSAVKDYMNANVAFARENGYVSTLTGRKRYIADIKSSNYNLRQFGERAAMNMPLQGSSADIIKIAMIHVYDALKKAGLRTKLILQVHDELVLDAPVEEAKKASEILKFEMENAVRLKVPLTVDVHIGMNWYDAK